LLLKAWLREPDGRETVRKNQPDEALLDLLVKQATEGLSPAEQRMLEALDGEAASLARRDIERAAAAVTLAAKTDGQALPPALAQKLVQQAEAHFMPNVATKITDRGNRPPRRANAAVARYSFALRDDGLVRRPPPAWCWRCSVGCVPSPAESRLVQHVPEVSTAPVLPPTPAEERAALMAKADSLKITLSATKDPAAGRCER